MASLAKTLATTETADPACCTAPAVALARAPLELADRLAGQDQAAFDELEGGLRTEEAWAVKLLIQALRAGTPWAWKLLHTSYFARVTGICLRILKDSDAAQECALRVEFNFVTRYVHQPRALATFPGYLWAMAWTTALRWSPRRESVGLPEELPGETLTADDIVRRSELAALQRALRELEPGQVELLRKRFAEDLTLREIAEANGTSLQNVDQTIRRLLKRLRKQLTA